MKTQIKITNDDRRNYDVITLIGGRSDCKHWYSVNTDYETKELFTTCCYCGRKKKTTLKRKGVNI